MEEQVAISYASKSISIADTDYMCPSDRKLLYNALCKIKDKEKEIIENAKKK